MGLLEPHGGYGRGDGQADLTVGQILGAASDEGAALSTARANFFEKFAAVEQFCARSLCTRRIAALPEWSLLAVTEGPIFQLRNGKAIRADHRKDERKDHVNLIATYVPMLPNARCIAGPATRSPTCRAASRLIWGSSPRTPSASHTRLSGAEPRADYAIHGGPIGPLFHLSFCSTLGKAGGIGAVMRGRRQKPGHFRLGSAPAPPWRGDPSPGRRRESPCPRSPTPPRRSGSPCRSWRRSAPSRPCRSGCPRRWCSRAASPCGRWCNWRRWSADSPCRCAGPQLSCTLEPAPTRISSLSPRRTAPNQMFAAASSTTLPITVAAGAIQAPVPISGAMPSRRRSSRLKLLVQAADEIGQAGLAVAAQPFGLQDGHQLRRRRCQGRC